MIATTVNTDGEKVKSARIAKGWSRRTLAEACSKLLGPISEDTVRMWEEYNKLPKNPSRRAVIALLVGLSLSELGIDAAPTPKPIPVLLVDADEHINIIEARQQLLRLKIENHINKVSEMATIEQSIVAIQSEVAYAEKTRRGDLLELLSDYQQFKAGFHKDQRQFGKH